MRIRRRVIGLSGVLALLVATAVPRAAAFDAAVRSPVADAAMRGDVDAVVRRDTHGGGRRLALALEREGVVDRSGQ